MLLDGPASALLAPLSASVRTVEAEADRASQQAVDATGGEAAAVAKRLLGMAAQREEETFALDSAGNPFARALAMVVQPRRTSTPGGGGWLRRPSTAGRASVSMSQSPLAARRSSPHVPDDDEEAEVAAAAVVAAAAAGSKGSQPPLTSRGTQPRSSALGFAWIGMRAEQAAEPAVEVELAAALPAEADFEGSNPMKARQISTLNSAAVPLGLGSSGGSGSSGGNSLADGIVESPASADLGPLPQGWTAHMDPGGSGQYYFVSTATGKTTWDRPKSPPANR